ncbi:MAG: hypothetical protein ACE5Z5_00670 [Candidatus Bathyarchaeia archaeon]
MSVTIKDVDEGVFRNFKAEAVRHGLRMGEAASEAFRLWIAFKRCGRVRDRRRMLRAAEDMDGLRKKSARGWSGVEEIRRWREQRRLF